MYTSSLRLEDPKKALTYSAVKGYIEKPLQLAQLKAIVDQLYMLVQASSLIHAGARFYLVPKIT
ncbi:MAG: hypothetical protein H7282_13135 [Cytophagaceae bacterium]|nr:hypothetical protein [Cytophagaceae bacterium]